MLEQGLYKLVGGHEVIEAGQGDGILHPRVVGVEGVILETPILTSSSKAMAQSKDSRWVRLC